MSVLVTGGAGYIGSHTCVDGSILVCFEGRGGWEG